MGTSLCSFTHPTNLSKMGNEYIDNLQRRVGKAKRAHQRSPWWARRSAPLPTLRIYLKWKRNYTVGWAKQSVPTSKAHGGRRSAPLLILRIYLKWYSNSSLMIE